MQVVEKVLFLSDFLSVSLGASLWPMDLMSILRHWLAHPLALGLLGLLPVLGLIAVLSLRRRRRALARWGSRSAVDALTSVRRRRRWLRSSCRLLGLIFLILGIAGPQWDRDQTPSTAPGRDVVVVLDLSRSMLAQDVLGRAAPNRLGRAIDAVQDLVDTVQRRGGHRLALVVFAAQARILCPLTHDYDHFRETLANLDPADPFLDIGPGSEGSPSGTRIGAGLREAVRSHDPQFRGHQDIVLVSDGDDPARDDEWREGLKIAQKAGISIHTVGVGDPDKGSPVPVGTEGQLLYQGQPVLTRLEEKPLVEIAKPTGGTYTAARTKVIRLGELFRDHIEPRASREDADEVLPVYQQHAGWFFGGALLFLAMEMILGDRGRRRKVAGARSTERGTRNAAVRLSPLLVLLTIGLISAAPADQIDDLIRQGNAAFERGDYAVAVDFYTRTEARVLDPGLVAFNKAAALYRLGQYREAELSYLCCREDATGERLVRVLYDLGNAIVQQAQDRDAKRLEQAIGSYEECLRRGGADSDLADDIKFNLQLARALRAKARNAKDQPNSDNPNPNDPSYPRDHPNDSRPGGELSPGSADPQGKDRAVADRSGDPFRDPASMNQPPGVGNLPLIPDQDKLAPLSSQDTVAYLEQVAARVQRERKAHKQRSVPLGARTEKDW
jgi:Ca-activated chloride channel family protein